MGGWFRGGVSLAALSVSFGCVLYNVDFDPDSGGSTTLDGTTSGSSVSVSASDPSASSGESAGTSGSGSGGEVGTSAAVTSGSTSGPGTTTDALTDTGDPTTTTTTGNQLCMNMEVTVYADLDMDGHGDPNAPLEVCPGQEPPDTSPLADDCDDGNPNVHPAYTEICDGVDNNCNGLIDEWSNTNLSCALFGETCYLLSYGGHYYYACKGLKKPDTVNGDCHEVVSGLGATAYHVKIEDELENQQMTMLATKLPWNPTIGLRDTQVFDQISDHKWTADGSVLAGYGAIKGSAPWAGGEPNSGAFRWIAIDRASLLWYDVDNLLSYPFICEGVPG